MSTKPSHLFFYPNLPYINSSLSSILTEPPYPVPLSRMSSTRMYPSTTCHPSLVFLLLRNLQSCQSLQSLATYLLCFVRYLISYALIPLPSLPHHNIRSAFNTGTPNSTNSTTVIKNPVCVQAQG